MIKEKLRQLIADQTGAKPEDIKIEKPPKAEFGDYAVFIKGNAEKAFESIKSQASNLKQIEKVEIKGNYINFFLTSEFVQSELARISSVAWDLGLDAYRGRTIMVEYTDPNPFKKFHIGHLMSNAIGEAITRLHEACGAKVIRANYQGDVGLHVAKAVYAHGDYAAGSKAYEESREAKIEIEAINKKIYDRSDPEINTRYDSGRKASLEEFEKIYARLGTRFDAYFFESEMGPVGLEIVKSHPDAFEQSNGAVIFKGSHTRVFINSQGLPTYEAKELGLNKTKFDKYHPDLSIIVTGNEIVEYFKVLMEAMQQVMPEVAAKTRHLPHGMLRLPTGKMSSRTGDVITADALIEKVKEELVRSAPRTTQGTGLPSTPRGAVEETAIGAIKYSILKQGIGNDIIFDFEKSLAVNGDSGVYLQYTYARFHSILEKSQASSTKFQTNFNELNHQAELNLIKHLIEFPDAITASAHDFAPNHLALYLYELANKANGFYEQVRILVDENEERKQARLVLVQTTTDILKRGLNILGIPAPRSV